MERRWPRLVLTLLTASAVGLASEASVAYASASAKHPAAAAEKKKRKKTSLAKAATWVAIGTQAKLTADKPAPEQFTDPSAPRVQQINGLITGLDFKGVAILTYTRAQADPASPSSPVGNYIVKVVVFGSAAAARKFRDADAKDVTDKGSLKKVGTYADGVVLDDSQGHTNLMFTIGNVAVDIRSGVAEKTPGDGVKEIKKLGAFVVANSKKR